MVCLWRAVDAEDEVLDVLVQAKRNKHAALKLMRKLDTYRTMCLAPQPDFRRVLAGVLAMELAA
jgi:transposase-like protein